MSQAQQRLNEHEQGLIGWLAAGRTNSQIGQCLGRSEKTIRNQLTVVYAKLGVVNRAQAVAVHLRMTLTRSGPPTSDSDEFRDIRPIGD